MPDETGMTWGERRQARSDVEEVLKDPGSAQFKFKGKSGSFVCGEVNAKNDFGAYPGFSSFVVDRRTGLPDVYAHGDHDTLDLERKVGNGTDHQARLDLAKCEGLLIYEDDRAGQMHYIDRDGRETCPTDNDPEHRC